MISRSDFLTGGFFVGLGLFLILASLPMEPPAHVPYGPGFFPTIVGSGMVLFGAIVVWGARHPSAAPSGRSGDDETVRHEITNPRVAIAGFILAPVAFILLVPVLGFLIAMPIIIGTLIGLLRGRWLSSFVVAIVLTLILQVAFQQVMRVPLPWGLLEPWSGVLTWR